MEESVKTIMARLYTSLRFNMAVELPQPAGIHIYSHGATINDFQNSQFPFIEFNQPYSSYMLGFDKTGHLKGEEKARIPKPRHKGDHPVALEKYNFGIIKRTCTKSARIAAISTGGKVVIDL